MVPFWADHQIGAILATHIDATPNSSHLESGLTTGVSYMPALLITVPILGPTTGGLELCLPSSVLLPVVDVKSTRPTQRADAELLMSQSPDGCSTMPHDSDSATATALGWCRGEARIYQNTSAFALFSWLHNLV